MTSIADPIQREEETIRFMPREHQTDAPNWWTRTKKKKIIKRRIAEVGATIYIYAKPSNEYTSRELIMFTTGASQWGFWTTEINCGIEKTYVPEKKYQWQPRYAGEKIYNYSIVHCSSEENAQKLMVQT